MPRTRIDSLLVQSGLAPDLSTARQMIRTKHVEVCKRGPYHQECRRLLYVHTPIPNRRGLEVRVARAGVGKANQATWSDTRQRWMLGDDWWRQLDGRRPSRRRARKSRR